MKISKIRFNSYLHFSKELEIDLTYPKGHPKSGKPLDKVCFIGQSGTGKTSILNLIKYFTADGDEPDEKLIDHTNLGQGSVEIHYEYSGGNFCRSPQGGGSNKFAYKRNGVTQSQNFAKELAASIKSSSPLILSFPFNVIPPENQVEKLKTTDSDKEFNQTQGTIESKRKRLAWDMSASDINDIATLVFNEVDIYVDRHARVSNEYLEKAKAETEKGNSDESSKNIQEIINWESKNPNPIKEIDEKFLKEILGKIGLEVEVDVTKYYKRGTEHRRNIENFLILKQNQQQIRLPYLSTGTKQIIYTALPLFFLRPTNGIVLLDQPEASLYPDIQLLVPQVYTSIAPENQFFFATHSPIVASAFDPWEIVELNYDQKSKTINRKPYYQGKERNLESYYLFPKYLRWDSILKLMLGVGVEANEERLEQLMKLATLESELKRMPGNDSEKQKKYADYKLLAEKLDVTTPVSSEISEKNK